MKALIDGDIILYSAAHAAQKFYYLVMYDGDHLFTERYLADTKHGLERLGLKESNPRVSVERVTIGEGEDKALHVAASMMSNILDAVGSSDPAVYLTGTGNFREEVATIRPYKGNRPEEKPIYYQVVKDYLLSLDYTTLVNGMEADDMLGIESTRLGDDSVICTIDKDLHMIPGNLYNWRSGVSTYITPEEAMQFFCRQLLTGDPVDNIPGLFNITGQMATKRIKQEVEVLGGPRILELYEGHEDALLEIGTLLWILRHPDERFTLEMLND